MKLLSKLLPNRGRKSNRTISHLSKGEIREAQMRLINYQNAQEDFRKLQRELSLTKNEKKRQILGERIADKIHYMTKEKTIIDNLTLRPQPKSIWQRILGRAA